MKSKKNKSFRVWRNSSPLAQFLPSPSQQAVQRETTKKKNEEEAEEGGARKKERRKEEKKERKKEEKKERKKERERETQVELLVRPVIAEALVWTKKKGPDRATYPLRAHRVKYGFGSVPIGWMWFTTP